MKKTYIGVKVVHAAPMNRGEFELTVKKYQTSSATDEGYVVVYEDGYVSWSPKKVFEKAYRFISLNEEDTGDLIKSIQVLIDKKSGAVVREKLYAVGLPALTGHSFIYGPTPNKNDTFDCIPPNTGSTYYIMELNREGDNVYLYEWSHNMQEWIAIDQNDKS